MAHLVKANPVIAGILFGLIAIVVVAVLISAKMANRPLPADDDDIWPDPDQQKGGDI